MAKEKDEHDHLDKLKKRFKNAPITDFIGQQLIYCRDGIAKIKLPFKPQFDQGLGIPSGCIKNGSF
jgi:acyl-coenzyme A thioesterase PaaI-like protein